MSFQVTGKNVDVGEAFQSYASDKISAVLHKYIGQYLAAHVRVEKERSRFHTGCSVRLKTGLVLESSGEGADAYASADAAFERLEKRLRRYKRRLTGHHHGTDARLAPETIANDFVVQVAEDEEPRAGHDGEDHPVIVAETERVVWELSVGEAVMRLDLTDDAFLVFRNAASGGLNVVYRRTDGNIGWIDPGPPTGIRKD